MITFRCPQCNREARAADEHAGKKAKCPGCAAVFQIPKASESGAAPPKPSSATRPKPDSPAPPAPSKSVARTPVKPPPPPPPPEEEEEEISEAVAADDDEPAEEPEEEEDDRPRKGKKKGRGRSSRRTGREGAWAPCPKCDSTDATKQYFTWWGGFVGPMIINSVRCNDCGTVYNGVKGDYNTTRILIYMLVPAVIAILGLGCVGVMSVVLGEM